MKKSLIIIDPQQEYSKNGGVPISNYDQIINRCISIVDCFESVTIIQHINNKGLFSGSGAQIDPRIKSLNYPVITKQHADSFQDTKLQSIIGISDLYICGMMTQNCVLMTALTAKDLNYNTHVIEDCTSSINTKVHNFSINALRSKSIDILTTEDIKKSRN